jgi:hypothetical protein
MAMAEMPAVVVCVCVCARARARERVPDAQAQRFIRHRVNTPVICLDAK